MNKILTNTIGEISKKLKEDKLTKINAFLGVYYDEKGKLGTLKEINSTLKRNINLNTNTYDEILGSAKFNELLKKWIFKSNNANAVSGYTMGCTGALSFCFNSYCRNKYLLVPSLRWSNYDIIAQEKEVNLIEYNLINNKKEFDIDDLINKINHLYLNNTQINILINDPCHNPSGYSLSEDEWKKIINYLNKLIVKEKINLIIDIAYLHFSNSKLLEILFEEINDKINCIFCYSFSKSFSLYGYRGGGCLLLSKDKNEREKFKEKLGDFSRSSWASSNHLMSDSFCEYIIKYPKKIIKNYKKVNTILKERAEILIRKCKENSIDFYPYKEGFFIFLICKNPVTVSKRLLKEHIYVMPYENGIRISLASIKKKDIVELIEKMSNFILL